MIPPVLRDFPEAFETERLIIRTPRPGGGKELNTAVCETIESLQEWMPWATPVPTVEQSEEYCRLAYSKYIARTDIPLNLFLKDDTTYVGGSGLHPKDWQVPSFEIGYWCRKKFEGQGYITEAVQAITRFGFETMGAKRIQIRCDSRNLRSRRVAERAGYQLEAELRNDSTATDGSLRHTLVFARIPSG